MMPLLRHKYFIDGEREGSSEKYGYGFFMKKRAVYFLLVYTSVSFSKVYLEYGKSWGRFGDNLLSYMHTKYISHITGIPVIYKPFVYSDQLKLSKNEINLKNDHMKEVTINNENIKKILDMFINKKNLIYKKNIIYKIPYFPEKIEYSFFRHLDKTWIFFDTDWKNKEFKKILKQNIAPLNDMLFSALPENKISIAVHVRDGGGFDSLDSQTFNPLKFPPLHYYIDSLKSIISMLGAENSYYIYIFTDHQNPIELIVYFKKYFPDDTLEFDCRLSGNKHDKNVLEDFFSLTRFHCLIRPQSNFSLTAAKIADYIIEIEPIEFVINDNNIYITKIDIKYSE